METKQDPDVQHCGACNTSARFEFHDDTKNCTFCGEVYEYTDHERREREAAA